MTGRKPTATKKQRALKRTDKKSFPTTPDEERFEARGRQPRIVAVGASAGGLEALEQFFRALGSDTGFAFVVIQHLSPDFPSMMDELLGRHSPMRICQITKGTQIEPNVIYLRPARQTLTVKRGVLELVDEDVHKHLSLPIDAFLNSLAQDVGDRAIGIIFSGTGSDGSAGAAVINEAGGTMLVQEPSTARFESMPRTIIERNLASGVASPAGLAALVHRLAAGLNLPGVDEETEDGQPLDPETVILRLLQRRCGTDFGYYKMSTVGRRIRRRAELSRTEGLSDYVTLLKRVPEELDLLTKDLLIGVTEFFRDAEAFQRFGDSAIAPIGRSLGGDEPFRVWVPGCATGEEAYSIAMVLSEAAREADVELNAKIFATDIYAPALEVAGRGIYDEASFGRLPSDFIERYFDTTSGRFQVKPSLRRLVVFSSHNLLKDPPFTRMDLISCRNLLIYFNEVAQQKVLTFFHLALNVNGTLFLGPSETLNDLSEEFAVIDSKWRIFRKLRDVRLRESLRMLPPSTFKAQRSEGFNVPVGPRGRASAIQAGLAHRRGLTKAYDMLLERHAPPSVLVDRQGMIVHVFGDARKYLSIASGMFTAQLVDSVDERLRHPILAGIERMRGSGASPFTRHLTLEGSEGGVLSMKLCIERLDRGEWVDDGYSLITFHEQRRNTIQSVSDAVPAPATGALIDDLEIYRERIAELEHELRVTEESLQSTIQEMETTNEELQATNEELMASNEELQSTNEELHSVNEELFTVSAEHQRKIDELLEVTADLDHVLTSTEIGVIYLDRELRLRRFTPAAAAIFNLLEHDVGRPFDHVRPRFKDFDLIDKLRTAASEGIGEYELEIEDRTYLLRILPYEVSPQLGGYGLTFIDLTQRKRAELAVLVSESRLREIVNTALDAIVVIDETGIIQSTNPATEYIFGYTNEELIGKNVSCLMPDDHAAGHDSYLENYRRSGVRKIIGIGREVQARRNDGTFVTVDLGIAEWRDAHGVRFFTGMMRDMTERKMVQRRLTDALRTITLAAEAGEMGTWHLDIETGALEFSDELLRILGQKREKWVGTPDAFAALIHPDDIERWRERREQALERGDRLDLEFRIVRPDGAVRWIHSRGDIRRTTAGGAVEAYGVMIDITERKQLEDRQALLIAELDHRVKNTLARMTSIVESSRKGAGSIDAYTVSIVGRLNALARSHARLSRSRWTGAGLKALVEEELAPYQLNSNVSVDGPDVVLNPEASQAMCMIFHELCTNAAKYGAFSRDTGYVRIDWEITNKKDRAWLEMTWHEDGGPIKKPGHTGFGTRLIRNLLRHGLGGTADLSIEEDGVNCQIRVPIANIR